MLLAHYLTNLIYPAYFATNNTIIMAYGRMLFEFLYLMAFEFIKGFFKKMNQLIGIAFFCSLLITRGLLFSRELCLAIVRTSGSNTLKSL